MSRIFPDPLLENFIYMSDTEKKDAATTKFEAARRQVAGSTFIVQRVHSINDCLAAYRIRCSAIRENMVATHNLAAYRLFSPPRSCDDYQSQWRWRAWNGKSGARQSSPPWCQGRHCLCDEVLRRTKYLSESVWYRKRNGKYCNGEIKRKKWNRLKYNVGSLVPFLSSKKIPSDSIWNSTKRQYLVCCDPYNSRLSVHFTNTLFVEQWQCFSFFFIAQCY